MAIELLSPEQLDADAARIAQLDAKWQKRHEAEEAAANEAGCESCRRVPGYRTSQLWERCDCCGNEPIYVE